MIFPPFTHEIMLYNHVGKKIFAIAPLKRVLARKKRTTVSDGSSHPYSVISSCHPQPVQCPKYPSQSQASNWCNTQQTLALNRLAS